MEWSEATSILFVELDKEPRVRATALNHVSIPATDVEESAAFYMDVFGLDALPAPNFGLPVRWLQLGSHQLHLFHVDEQPARNYQHLAIEVDDFEEAYRRLNKLGAFAEGRFGKLYELPGGAVQMYFRDPSDNLVEIDHPSVDQLDRAVFGTDLEKLDDHFPQTVEQQRARLIFQSER